jgi:hypothetical protein
MKSEIPPDQGKNIAENKQAVPVKKRRDEPMTFSRHVNYLVRLLDDWTQERAKRGLDSDAWLLALHEHYSEQMRADNERIWTTGSILLPLSISAFAALVSIDELTRWKAFVLACGSIALIWVWLFIAENHRAFQQKSDAWLVAIKHHIGIKDTSPIKTYGNWMNNALTFRGAIQKMRWGIAFAITLAWLIVWIYVPFK